jgi:hypothetical protein
MTIAMGVAGVRPNHGSEPQRLVKVLLIINNGLFIFRRDNGGVIRNGDLSQRCGRLDA